MNGRLIIFNRCIVGLLACLLCGLAHSANVKFKSKRTGVITRDPVGHAASQYNQMPSFKVIFNSCAEGRPPGDVCEVELEGPRVENGISYPSMIGRDAFDILKDEGCEQYADKSAGVLAIPIPGVKFTGPGQAMITNANDYNNFGKAGFPTCAGACMLVSAGPIIVDSNGKNLFGSKDSTVGFMRMPMKYNGQSCPAATNGGPKPNVIPAGADEPKPPKGPTDCPVGSTFGKVQFGNSPEVGRCVKAGTPGQPTPPPNPNDPNPPPDSCVGSCDKWDPRNNNTDGKPDMNTGTSGGGSTPPTSGPLGTDASKPASENASAPSDSSLSASCSEFKCKNQDPATCEIARLTWNNKCIEEKAADDLLKSQLYKDGNTAMSADGFAGIKKELGFGDNGVVDLEGAIKKDTFLTKGGLSDLSFTVSNQNITIPFSKLNKYLSMMGDIAVAFALIAAARILTSSV